MIPGFSVQWGKYQVVYYRFSTLSLNLNLLFSSQDVEWARKLVKQYAEDDSLDQYNLGINKDKIDLSNVTTLDYSAAAKTLVRNWYKTNLNYNYDKGRENNDTGKFIILRMMFI